MQIAAGHQPKMIDEDEWPHQLISLKEDEHQMI